MDTPREASALDVMGRRWDGLSARRRGRATTRLLTELGALLRVQLPGLRAGTRPWRELLGAAGAALEAALDEPGYGFDAELTRRMIAALTLYPELGIPGFINDLAEILFVPRAERSEYVENRATLPPYKISKLMLEYALGSRRLNLLVGALTAPFCAGRCDRPPVGCCHILGYDLGLVPEGMLRLQELEARRSGWDPPAQETLDRCRYHGPVGCTLALFKSPACVRYLCPPLEQDLRRRFAARPAPLDRFLAASAAFGNSHIGRRRVFEALDLLVEAGDNLVSL